MELPAHTPVDQPPQSPRHDSSVPTNEQPPQTPRSGTRIPLFENGDASSTEKFIPVTWRGLDLELDFHKDATVEDLATTLAYKLGTDIHKIKLLAKPKLGIMKHPFDKRPLREIREKATTVQVIATSNKELAALNQEIQQGRKLAGRLRGGAGTTGTVKASKSRDWKKIQDESKYAFHTIQPLPYLPNPEKSQRFLERLASDPGIKASMRKHGFSVGLLTEMNPAEHTTHESRTLGLNRNRGEVIELRLRTDRYDGYRDYKVIRKTLCHELSHNIWGEHDSNFWALTKEIEKEVEQNDWKHGGHKLTESEFYNPGDTMDEDEYEHADHGGWTGGEFVLGSANPSVSDTTGLSRRELTARAAQSRIEKEHQTKKAEEEHPAEEAQ